ncbi:MAG: flippase-like domain-containing protein, partial [Muribaculaceae bacterium]|nr:flippase-like domain-containing protein [Muribaculaceae bacterium]
PRMGELWRCGYISQRQQAPFATVFGSMIADRLADTLAVLIIAIITFACAHAAMSEFASSSDIGLRVLAFLHSPWIWIAGVAVMTLTWWLMACRHKSPLLNRLATLIRGAWLGFASILTMPRKSLWLGLTAAIWICYFVEMWISMMAFSDTATLLQTQGISAALITFVFGTVAMAIPSQGGIGPWQGAVVLALSVLYGIDHNIALSFATLALGLQTLLTIVLGMYSFISIAVHKRRQNRIKLS